MAGLDMKELSFGGWGNLYKKMGRTERRPGEPIDCDVVLNLVEKRGKE